MQTCLFSADDAFGTASEEEMVSFCPFSDFGSGENFDSDFDMDWLLI